MKSRNSWANITRYFHALSHRNFRYFWFGQCISLIGTWMQNIGQTWLIYSITKSAFLLGIVGTLQYLPVMFFSLFAGPFVDRFKKKTILIYTQGFSMILAFILALLVYTDWIQYWHILILAALLGIVNTLDMPTRQSFVIELVGKEDLPNAIALNSSIFNAARIIGPAVAGILMGYLGIAACFFINAVSFIPVIWGISRISTKAADKEQKEAENIIADIKAGLLYVYRTGVLFRTILVVAAVGTFVVNFSVLVPVFAKNILRQNETGFGFLMSFMGAGSLAGALFLAAKSRTKHRGMILLASSVLVSVLMVLIGFSGSFYLSALLLAFTGFFNTTFFTSANANMQLNSNNEYRGRAMSVYTLCFAGTTPIGNFFAGTITEHFGVKWGFISCGAITLFLIGVIYLVIYMRKHKYSGKGSF